MAKPTIQQLFGENASVAGNALTIQFADFAAIGWSSAAGTTDAEKWATALIKQWRVFYEANAATDQALAVNAPFRGLTTRGTDTKREFSYGIQIYEPDTGNTSPDPDNL